MSFPSKMIMMWFSFLMLFIIEYLAKFHFTCEWFIFILDVLIKKPSKFKFYFHSGGNFELAQDKRSWNLKKDITNLAKKKLLS